MARGRNPQAFAKRKRELDKKRKKAEKLARKKDRPEGAPPEDEDPSLTDGLFPPDEPEEDVEGSEEGDDEASPTAG